MNLFVWIPSMFALGVVSLLICLAFVDGCERI